MKKATVIVFLFFLLFMAGDMSSEEVKTELFVMDKTYGLKQISPHPCKKSTEINANLCTADYIGDTISRMLMVDVYQFSSAADALSFINLKIATSIQSGAKPSNFDAPNVDDVRYYNRITKRADQVETACWPAEKTVVFIRGRNLNVPEEMISDYKQKYPPTVHFNTSDFEPQKILKDDMQKKMDIINKYEKDRGPTNRNTNKSKEYLAMIAQCGVEMQIRCRLGMTDKDNKIECPIALMLDDGKRRAEWGNLRQQILIKQVVVENVDWDQMNKTTCKHDDREMSLKMIQLLNATRKDLKDVPIELLPPEFAPDIAPK